MYLPAHFAETRPALLHAAIAAHPLATLVTLSARGVEANPLPMLLRPGLGAHGELHGHVARANPLWQEHPADAEVLAVFMGAQTYVSPSHYPGKREHGKVVPTWNYITVQARGRLHVIDDTSWKRALVSELTEVHEQTQQQPWQVGDAPADYIDKMLSAIVGFRIEITELTGKWKTSQNQAPANRAGVIAALSAQADDNAQAMARAIRAYDDKSD